MRTSIAGAALLLAGAGAAGLAAAADIDGTGLALNGSDTLADVTSNDVFSACSAAFTDWTTSPLTYQGGGSRVGAGNMFQGAQAISPMSSALKNTEYCPPLPSTTTVYSAPLTPVAGSSALTAGLLVGLDGVSITANQVMSCSSGAASQIGGATMAVTADGTGTPATNPPATCPGCDATGNYTFGAAGSTAYAGQPSFDALAVLYFGLTHDKNYSGCASPVRKTLIRNWKYLFNSDCGTGDGTCSGGLTHAWRRSDLSGTTDAFVSIINPPAGTLANGKGAAVAVGIGSLPQFLSVADGGNAAVTAPGAVRKSVPFCNSVDANTVPAPISVGGSADFSDADPVRTNCVPNVDGVCSGFKLQATTGGNFAGDLGVVLPILIPDTASVHAADRYPQTTCSAACAPFPIFKLSQQSKYPGAVCPNGAAPTGGNICFMPYTGPDAAPNPQCVATNTDKCADVVGGRPDGRRYNLVTMVPSTQVPAAFRQGSYQFAVDASTPVPRLLTGSFHKIHSVVPGSNYAAGIGTETGTTGICQEGDDTSQIGCLTDSDPCSIGYAGRESDQGFPGDASGPTAQPLKGLSVNGTTPFTPDSVAIPAVGHSDPDLAIKNLVSSAGTLPLYPLSRRLYFATIYGFGNLQGHEKELAECYGTSTIMSTAMTNNGFVAAPSGVTCEDYPETASTTTPPANVQGPSNVALGGCGTAVTTESNGCAGAGQLKDIHGANVPQL